MQELEMYNDNQLSIYSDEIVDDMTIAKGVKDLLIAFPDTNVELFGLLARRVIVKGFTNKRFIDAVNYVIDNCKYRKITIADIMNFDKNIKLYTGKEYVEMQSKGISHINFEMRILNGTKFWILKNDLKKQNRK